MISIQKEDFDHCVEYRKLQEAADGDSFIVTCTKLVKDYCEQGLVSNIYLEHYPGMTDKQLLQICTDARNRWSLGHISLIHRVGELAATEQVLFLGITSKEQSTAFEAAEFILDALKNSIAIWAKQTTPKGSRWLTSS